MDPNLYDQSRQWYPKLATAETQEHPEAPTHQWALFQESGRHTGGCSQAWFHSCPWSGPGRWWRWSRIPAKRTQETRVQPSSPQASWAAITQRLHQPSSTGNKDPRLWCHHQGTGLPGQTRWGDQTTCLLIPGMSAPWQIQIPTRGSQS